MANHMGISHPDYAQVVKCYRATITVNLLSQKGQAMKQYRIIPQLGLPMKSKSSEKLKWHSTNICAL